MSTILYSGSGELWLLSVRQNNKNGTAHHKFERNLTMVLWASLAKTKFKMSKSFYQVSLHSLAGWLTHRGSAIW